MMVRERTLRNFLGGSGSRSRIHSRFHNRVALVSWPSRLLHGGSYLPWASGRSGRGGAVYGDDDGCLQYGGDSHGRVGRRRPLYNASLVRVNNRPGHCHDRDCSWQLSPAVDERLRRAGVCRVSGKMRDRLFIGTTGRKIIFQPVGG